MRKTWIEIVQKTAIPICLILAIAYCILLTEYQKEESAVKDYQIAKLYQSIDACEDQLLRLEGKLFPGENFLESSEILYGEYDAESQTIPLTLTLTPIEALRTATEALLHVNGKSLVLKPEGEAYSIEYHAPLFEAQRISAVTWRGGETAQTFPLYWEIHPADQLIPTYYSYATGHSTAGRGEGGAYSLTLHFYLLAIPEQFGAVREIKLIEFRDGVAQAPKEIHRAMRNIIPGSVFAVEKTVRGTLAAGSSLELLIELVSEHGLRYHFTVQRICGGEELDWGQPTALEVIGADGSVLYSRSGAS